MIKEMLDESEKYGFYCDGKCDFDDESFMFLSTKKIFLFFFIYRKISKLSARKSPRRNKLLIVFETKQDYGCHLSCVLPHVGLKRTRYAIVVWEFLINSTLSGY